MYEYKIPAIDKTDTMMNYSFDTLRTFVEAAALKSFSATARKLNKSQSTVSTLIANFETDIGVLLFERQGRQSILTPAGRKVLSLVEDILSANERLYALSIELNQQVESRLSCCFSDIYQPPHTDYLMQEMDAKFPQLEFEFIIAESEDTLSLLQNGHVHIGMIDSRAEYPPDIASARLPKQGEMGLYVIQDHPLTKVTKLTHQHLTMTRQLHLSSKNQLMINSEKLWVAPTYLLLLEMAEQGMGWSILPTWLVKQFGHDKLVSLQYAQWPKLIDVDLVWSKTNPPGLAGYWLINQLLTE